MSCQNCKSVRTKVKVIIMAVQKKGQSLAVRIKQAQVQVALQQDAVAAERERLAEHRAALSTLVDQRKRGVK